MINLGMEIQNPLIDVVGATIGRLQAGSARPYIRRDRACMILGAVA